jgi:hypothetical protein
LEVASDTTLATLSALVQVAFGWDGGHLHCFDVRGIGYGPDELREPFGGRGFVLEPRLRSEDAAVLGVVAPRPGAVLDYTYDLGDDWRHRIEDVGVAEPDRLYPRCTAGKGRAPEEDTGAARHGSFDASGPANLTGIMHRRFRAVRGAELATRAGAVVDDPVFSGLFPELEAERAGCDCGHDHHLEVANRLVRRYRPVPESELADLAADTALVRTTLALARWPVGSVTAEPSRRPRCFARPRHCRRWRNSVWTNRCRVPSTRVPSRNTSVRERG